MHAHVQVHAYTCAAQHTSTSDRQRSYTYNRQASNDKPQTDGRHKYRSGEFKFGFALSQIYRKTLFLFFNMTFNTSFCPLWGFFNACTNIESLFILSLRPCFEHCPSLLVNPRLSGMGLLLLKGRFAILPVVSLWKGKSERVCPGPPLYYGRTGTHAHSCEVSPITDNFV